MFELLTFGNDWSHFNTPDCDCSNCDKFKEEETTKDKTVVKSNSGSWDFQG